MQDCCHQLIRHFSIRQYWSILTIIVLTPFFLAVAIPILPTFDDWTSLVSPSFEPFFSKERFLFFGYHWRPFDSIFGYIVGRNPQLLFPLLNHIWTCLLCNSRISSCKKTPPQFICLQHSHTLFLPFTWNVGNCVGCRRLKSDLRQPLGTIVHIIIFIASGEKKIHCLAVFHLYCHTL